MSVENLKIAVVCGGFSGESVVSLKSGAFVLSQMPKNYQGYLVKILPEGWSVTIDNEEYPIDKSDFSFIKNNEKICFDVVFLIIHGTPGEDGLLQSYFDLIQLPYTGSNHYASALTFNKKDCLAVLRPFGIKTANSLIHNSYQSYTFEEVEKTLGIPFFVKANQSGSSLGVNKVYNAADYEKAIQEALAEGDEILIESFLDGREFSVGVMQWQNEVKGVAVTEIISDNDFFDFEAKYLGKSKEVTPAEIPLEIEEKLLRLTEKVYALLNLSGFARVDYIVQNDEPYMIEVNTLPGLSPASIFPQQVSYLEIPFSEIIENEVQAALQKK